MKQMKNPFDVKIGQVWKPKDRRRKRNLRWLTGGVAENRNSPLLNTEIKKGRFVLRSTLKV